MTRVMRTAIQEKRHLLMEELLKLGVYKKDDKHLYELTLTDLEEVFEYMETSVEGQLND